MKRIGIPKEVLNCRDWLLANKRFQDYNHMLEVIHAAENDHKVSGELTYWTKSILEEYCHAHKIIPAYRLGRREWSGEMEFDLNTEAAEDLFEMLFREQAKREGR